MTRIRVGSFHYNRPGEIENEGYIVANDPLYLIKPSSTPEPWNNEPMFREWAKKEYPLTVEGKEITIEVKVFNCEARGL